MTLKPIRILWLAALSAGGLAISSCSGGSSSPCGAPVKTSSGAEWVCTFADDFDGDALNRSKWQVTKTSAIGFTQSARECYVDDPAHVKVADGLLTLRATTLQSPAPCGSFTTQYQSGMVFSKGRFAQTYGRFEVRAKLPRGSGFQPALWMYPQNLAYGRRSGEIDIAESFGNADVVVPHLHLRDAAGADHPRGAYCRVANASESFHTYTVEWQPTEFRFLYDGVPCMTVRHWDSGPPLLPPQPFDKPFFLLLQLGLGYGRNAPGTGTRFPGELQVDYVRAWR
jgi:beta-glucanase (GH16 family)